MAVACTNTTIAKYNTEYTMTFNAATSSVVDATEVFTVTPTVAGSRIAIAIKVGITHGAVAYSIAKGGQWGSVAAVTGSVAQAATEIIVFDDAKIMSTSGTYVITLTPASGKRLLTDHAATMQVIEMP